jgi:hypothetical protein
LPPSSISVVIGGRVGRGSPITRGTPAHRTAEPLRALDRRGPLALVRAAQRERLALVPRAPGPADAVDMDVGVAGQLPRHHRRQALDVEAAGRHVGRHQHRAAVVGEPQQHLVALALLELAVQRQRREPALAEPRAHVADIVAGVAEHQRRLRSVLQQQRRQRVHPRRRLDREERLLDVHAAVASSIVIVAGSRCSARLIARISSG